MMGCTSEVMGCEKFLPQIDLTHVSVQLIVKDAFYFAINTPCFSYFISIDTFMDFLYINL